MRRIVILCVTGLSLLATNAYGQAEGAADLRAQAADMIVRICSAAPEMSDLADPTAHCTCGARVMVSGLNERQLIVFTRVFTHFPDREAARAEAERMISDGGFAQSEITEMGSLLGSADNIMEECPT